MTKEERLAYQRDRRKRTGNADVRKYEKTVNGFLMRTYRNMQSRVEGVQHLKSHLYGGKELLSRDLFYAFSKSNQEFLQLFSQWEQANYDRKLTPSIDRKFSNQGYTLENIQWITHSENSRKGALSRHHGS